MSRKPRAESSVNDPTTFVDANYATSMRKQKDASGGEDGDPTARRAIKQNDGSG